MAAIFKDMGELWLVITFFSAVTFGLVEQVINFSSIAFLTNVLSGK